MKNILNKLKSTAVLNVFKYSMVKYIALAFVFFREIVNAKILGPEMVGILGNLILIISYCGYANLGVVYAMNREWIVYKDNEGESDKAREVINTSFSALSIVSLIFLIASISSIFVFEGISKWYMSLLFIIAITEQYKNFFINYFRLLNNLNMINLIELLNGIGTLILILLLGGSFKILGVLFAMTIIGIVIFLVSIIKVPKINIKINKEILKTLISIGIPLLIYNLGFYILTTIDRFVIIKFLGNEALGYYTFANQMATATLVFISSILFLFYPKMISKYNSGDNSEIIKSIYSYTGLIELFNIVFIFIGVIVIKPFIDIILPNFKGSISTYNILLMAIIMSNFSYFSNVFIIAKKKQNVLVVVQILSIIINLLLNILGVKLNLDIIGVAIATLITNTIYSFIQHYIVNYKIRKSNFIKDLVKMYSGMIIISTYLVTVVIIDLNYMKIVLGLFIIMLLMIPKFFNIKKLIDDIK